jgi:mono/diheme cytochrome c family protein
MRHAARVVAVIAAAAAADAGAADVFGDYTGRQLYERFCASCHGAAGYGDGPVAPALKVMMPDLTRMYQRHGGSFPEDRVRQIIDGRQVVPVHGTRYMPVWGQEFFVAEGAEADAAARVDKIVDKLVEYLRSIQQ